MPSYPAWLARSTSFSMPNLWPRIVEVFKQNLKGPDARGAGAEGSAARACGRVTAAAARMPARTIASRRESLPVFIRSPIPEFRRAGQNGFAQEAGRPVPRPLLVPFVGDGGQGTARPPAVRK